MRNGREKVRRQKNETEEPVGTKTDDVSGDAEQSLVSER